MPSAKRFAEGEGPVLPVPEGGVDEGFDLAQLDAITPQSLGRKTCYKLWSETELKNYMLSPERKYKQGSEPRTDFSPRRKDTFNRKLNAIITGFSLSHKWWDMQLLFYDLIHLL